MAGSEDDWVSIVGLGSLLSKRSALTSFPDLRHFRTGIVHGYRRVFDHVGVIFIEKGLVETDSLELSSVAATEDPNMFLLVSVFEIPARDLPVFFAREDFFLINQVRVAEYPTGCWEGILPPGYAPTALARMCCKFDNDEALIAARFGDRAAFEARFRAHYNGKIYRSDILPCRPYLKHCLVAAERLGSAFRANFEQSSFLADGSGTIADYLAARPGWDEQTPLGSYDRYQG